MLNTNKIYKNSGKKKIILRQKLNCSLGSSLCHSLQNATLFFHSTIAKYMNLRKKINGPILQRRHLSLHLDFIFNINNPLISCHYSNCESCRPTIMWQACHKNKKAYRYLHKMKQDISVSIFRLTPLRFYTQQHIYSTLANNLKLGQL